MVIDAKTVILTLVVILIAFFAGLRIIRAFALTIAQENHAANVADDMNTEAKRVKRERDAEAAETVAYKKAAPLLPATSPAAVATQQQLEMEPSKSLDEVV
mmetsp:Transcript_21172/g.38209  ORF Transcript_21172/g.38209 Transcript_21172/m.38209 type:complete len:101 (-) Transcript_21172:1966-2268(-)|eukprot:CAMPEP_0198295066 /NCGR_PEP_ID=MMETSP1449-20131203/25640_1 /TAXON_ID=420275 /ORGANISM="Attheya septentrionalis, Strain CCMP2084" /LENGTH=100 /DNA_ID=CAMNT_0043995245 /DNA_START=131 /DNA_END=433 /DNA_ORIENTATION=+